MCTLVSSTHNASLPICTYVPTYIHTYIYRYPPRSRRGLISYSALSRLFTLTHSCRHRSCPRNSAEDRGQESLKKERDLIFYDAVSPFRSNIRFLSLRKTRIEKNIINAGSQDRYFVANASRSDILNAYKKCNECKKNCCLWQT